MKALAFSAILFLATGIFAADSAAPAAAAINSFGVDLLRNVAKPDANALYSPYSIQITLAMTYAGANGVTRDEMARVLHFGTNEMQMRQSFALLQTQLDGMMQRSARVANEKMGKGFAIIPNPINFVTANRLFGGASYPFRRSFMECLRTNYHEEFLQLDFTRDPAAATKMLNDLVFSYTRMGIPDLIPEGALDKDTRLVLVSAVYLKAPWAEAFDSHATQPAPFRLPGGSSVEVPMMANRLTVGYMKYNGFTALSLPYSGDELQFLILLPDATNGLVGLESRMTQPGACANLPTREMIIRLPKFKVAPPTLSFAPILRGLGMKTAFDSRADFTRMARTGFFITGAYHKTFLKLDEKGTEATAATAVVAGEEGIEPKVMMVTVDHPFVFAIQHRASGACLFVGHVVDPR